MDSNTFCCPFCESVDFIKYGKRNGNQRFKCLSFGHVFLKTTNTIFSSTKLNRSCLRNLIVLIIDGTKLETISDVLKISRRTAYMWRMKIYKVAGEMIKNIELSGKVWIDEKLIRVNKRFLVTKSNGKQYRGVSINQIVIACAIDSNGNKYAEIVGRGHISSKQCINSYGKHIKPESLIIHDGIFSFGQLIKELHAKDEIHKSITNSSKRYMQPINSFCAEIERNMVIHQGIRDENLQDYLNWIVFKSSINSDNIDSKIDELEAKCFQSKVVYRIKDRY